MPVKFFAMPTEIARKYQRGEPDAYGNPPQIRLSDGDGIPCRHCLKNVPAGKNYLVLAYRPFETKQAYAETGPIFLCADPCQPHTPTKQLPEILDSPDYIIRGYNRCEEIVYGTGMVVPTNEISGKAQQALKDERVVSVHVRSARNNCFQCKIEAEPV